jgi:Fe(3+) dicitrate transport protein
LGIMQNYFCFLEANGCLPSKNDSITKLNLQMKWFLIFLSILVFSVSSIAQTGTIVGTITNSLGQKTELATIYLREANKTILSNREGRYAIYDIPPGTYTLVVSFVGLETRELKILVKNGEINVVNIQMEQSSKTLRGVVVMGVQSKNGLGKLPEVMGTVIYSGKKTEVIVLDSLDANTAQNNPRQILGRIPGMNFSETEGSGFPSNGFGLRGLDPSQSIEMNMRQNGYNISADPYGYNEAYYNPALEAVERIQIVRGASSLQFGPQFGGTVNFIMKQGPADKTFEYNTQQTSGSYNLFNSFHSVGGSYKKWNYYSYIQYKNSDGWRPHSGFRALTGYGKLEYKANPRLTLGIEYSLLRNRIQMPGGLTDEEFQRDSRQSFRARNWLNSPWNLVSVSTEYKWTAHTNFSFQSTLESGRRSLVWKNEYGGPGAPDSILPLTNHYAEREVEAEVFTSSSSEFRLLSNYELFGSENSLSAGFRVFIGKMRRMQGGPGSAASDFDLNLYGGDYKNNLNFNTTNLAPFVENIFRITPALSIVPGFRFEYIHSSINGYITDSTRLYPDASRNRYFPLLGLGIQYRIFRTTSFYANWSQAYRPMDYSALTPLGVSSKIDQHLKDASGFNADLGWRGVFSNFLNFDIGGFYLAYHKRIGLLTLTDPITGLPYTLRTNTGNSVSEGIESYVEVNPFKILFARSRIGNISIFNSFAYIDAKYESGTFNQSGQSLRGNRVEYSPRTIERLGITYGLRSVSVTFLSSSISRSYGDANNTVSSSDADIGIIPAYRVMDISAVYKFRNYKFKAGLNNIADKHYFTKRTDEYPGPGIIPGAGRSYYISWAAKF